MAMLDGEAPPAIAKSRYGIGSGRITASEAVEMGLVPDRKRINRWATRGRLEPVGRTEKGHRPLYRQADIRELNRKAAADHRSTERRSDPSYVPPENV